MALRPSDRPALNDGRAAFLHPEGELVRLKEARKGLARFCFSRAFHRLAAEGRNLAGRGA